MGNKFTSELFDEFGNYRNHTLVHSTTLTKEDIQSQIIPNNNFIYEVNDRDVVEVLPDYDNYVQNFG